MTHSLYPVKNSKLVKIKTHTPTFGKSDNNFSDVGLFHRSEIQVLRIDCPFRKRCKERTERQKDRIYQFVTDLIECDLKQAMNFSEFLFGEN